jgi:membrane protease YdiL (CAAX protease family)
MSTVQEPETDKWKGHRPGGLLPDDQDEEGLPGTDVLVMFAVFFELGLAILSLFLGWWLGHNPLTHFSWSLPSVLWGLAATLPLVLLFLGMLRWPIGPLARIKSFIEEEFVPMLASCSWSDIGLIALSAGVGEEMLFRGVLQSAMAGWMGDLPGLFLSAALFGLLHPISLPYVFVSMFLGAYLGALYLLEGNLLTVILVHTAYDFTLMAYLLRIRFRGQPVNPITPVDSDQDIDCYDGEG